MTVAQALTLAFQYVNQSMPDLAIAEMAHDLEMYPPDHVLAALKRCRSELKVIRYGDILDRLPGGHPGPEEAWAVIGPSLQNEAVTVVWTDPMREAFGVAVGLADDLVAARMAFKETYTKLVSEARAKNHQPAWSVSLGTDKAGRELAILEAVKAGKLSQSYVGKFLPQAETSAVPLPQIGVMR